ncbi:cation transporter [Nannocystis bainbridge]|uniref:Cation diffusion facilitator family transporter n=1 Tax=Nannocystis bainbridge TaxID=2995303 RepID=A0ABT5E6I6_9BACT|nr:cation diffusion facilitator family transporter [Nannocystis bainbridge]MDC0721469.1 cation diffusion facilitator family transporter [Nannocystis bainbridge]
MSAKCCGTPIQVAPGYSRALWIALAVNGGMFVVEVVAGLFAGSLSLQADALDFLGDAGNYALSLWAASRALGVRARVATVKGVTMGLFGLWVLGRAVLSLAGGELPHAEVMGATGVVALIANLAVAVLLYRYRDGDSNMRSVWLCTRNDALGNLAVLLAAGGVLAFGSRWPDLLVAVLISGLALVSAVQVLAQARREQRQSRASG